MSYIKITIFNYFHLQLYNTSLQFVLYYNIYLLRNYLLYEVFKFTDFAKMYIKNNKIQFETIEYLTKIDHYLNYL